MKVLLKRKQIVVALIISNVFLLSTINKTQEEKDMSLYRAISEIESAASKSAEVQIHWDTLDDFDKLESIHLLDIELTRAFEIFNAAGKHFQPLKEYSHSLGNIKNAIKTGDEDQQIELIEVLTINLRALDLFLMDNNVLELTQDEILMKWKDIK